MHGNIILVCLICNIELVPIIDDIDTDEEVGRLDLILLKKSVEVTGWLKMGGGGGQKLDEA